MLGYFPDPHPDELFYSLCARFGERMGFTTLRQVVEELFGDGQVIATVAFPSHLDQLVARLPPGSRYSATSIIANHTLLPFFGPFLPPPRLMRLRADMQGNKGPSLQMRAGVMASTVPLPSTLRYCSRCVQEDRARFGETYWHRLFQLPGVQICPFHQVWLEESTVQIRHRQTRQAFVTAEQTLQVLPLPGSVQNSPTEQLLLSLAQDSAWLLEHPHLAPGLEFFQRRYRQELFAKHLATHRGRVTMAALQEQFFSCHPPEVLQDLHCNLNTQISDHWLARLVRKPKGAHHPLRHLLLMHFLGHCAADFFACSTARHPFGEGPWPCLNPVCRFYRKPSITSCQIVYPPSMGGHPTGVFACACGYTYARSGPDTCTEDRFRQGRNIQYGSLWDATLRRLWENPIFSVNAIAQHLRVDPLTAKRGAVRLGLPLTRRHEKALIQLKPLAPRQAPAAPCPTRTDLYARREDWLAAIQAHPGCGTKALRNLLPGLYAGLYRHDRIWLQSHLPAPKPRPHSSRVKWEQRDEEYAERVRSLAPTFKDTSGRPTQVTVAAIGRHIRQLAILQQHLHKLPSTAVALDELIETREAFALRRVQWATTIFLQEHYYPQRWEFIRRAGLARISKWPAIEHAVWSALQTLEQQIILSGIDLHTNASS